MATNTARLYKNVPSLTHFNFEVTGIYSITSGGDYGTWSVRMLDANGVVQLSYNNVTLTSTPTNTIIAYNDDYNSIVRVDLECTFTTTESITFYLQSFQVQDFGNLWWRGYLQPENLTRSFVTPEYMISLSATDALVNLQDIDFPYQPTTAGTTSYLDLIKRCVDQTGLEIPFLQSQLNITTPPLSSVTLLDNLIAQQRRFLNIDSGKVSYTNCFDALDQMLNAFNCFIVQSEGKYKITQKNEINSLKTVYNLSDLSNVTSSFNRQIDITNTQTLLGSDELSKIRPNVGEDITFNNLDAGRYFPTLINTTYNANAWFNGTGSSAYNVLVGWDSATGSLKVTNTYTGSTQQSKYVRCQTILLNHNSGSTATFTINTQITSISFTGSSHNYPMMRLALIDSTNKQVSFVDRPYPTGGTQQLFTETLAFPATGLYTLRVWMIPDNSSHISSITILYNTITVFKDNDISNTAKTLIEGTVNSSTAIQVDAQDLFFGDGSTVYEVGSLWYAPSALTSQWYNYGSATKMTLQRLLVTNKLALSNKFRNYLRVTIRDAARVYPNNALLIGSKVYDIISHSYDIKNSWVELELVEHLTNSINVTITETKLSNS